MKNSKDGFTLIEVMTTVGVIGLLATLGSYAVMSGVNNARKKTAEAELQFLSAAVIQLAWDTGKWPNRTPRTNGGSDEIWNLNSDAYGITGTDGSFHNWQGPYYDLGYVDPWGNPYFFDPDYRVAGEMRAVVGSFGPNGQGRNRYDSDDIYVRVDD